MRKMTPSMISLLIAIVCSVPWVKGQFPKVCVNLESLKNKTCCPKPNGYHEPCGSDGNRGECQELRVRRWDGTYSHYQEFHRKDERHNWPNALFNRTCKCKSNFAGYDCSKCQYGYYGYDCKKKKTLKRRNFAQWTKEEKDRFMSYINKTRYVDSEYVVTTSSYQQIQDQIASRGDPTGLFSNITTFELFVWIHHFTVLKNVPPDDNMDAGSDFAHEGQGFLTWHRLFILTVERAIQEVTLDYNFAMPYWDWTSNKETCEICTEDLLGVAGENGTVKGKYLNDWHTICSEKETLQKTQICDLKHKKPFLKRLKDSDRKVHEDFPTRDEVNFALRFEQFDLPPYNRNSSCSFRNLLEGFVNTSTGYPTPNVHTLHNQVHYAIGGTMKSSFSSANDPIFFLHHSFVDRIFEKWLRKYNKDASILSSYGAPLGHNRRDIIVPLFPVYTHEEIFKKSFELGYDFEDVDGEGNSADDEKSSPSSWGTCPAESAVSRTEPSVTVRNNNTCKILVGVLAAFLLFC